MQTPKALQSLTAALALAAAATATVIPLPATAAYPDKPLRLVVPFPAGGPSDAAARTIARAWNKTTGHPVVVDNRPGANGTLAAQTVLTARPDGYTVLWGVGSMAGIPELALKPPFASFATFAPVSTVGEFAFGLFVHPDVQSRSVDALVKQARAQPNALNFATGTLSEYLAAAQFMKASKTTMTRISYKGGAQAMPDLVAGRVQLYFTPIALGLPHARDNRLRMLGTLLPKRSPAAPDVPTMTEAGMPGVTVPTWQAVFGPPQMAPEAVNYLARETQRAVQDAEVLAQFERLVMQPGASTPAQLGTAVQEGIETWRAFIRDNNIPKE